MADSRARSIYKSLTWRLSGSVYTIFAVFILTGNIDHSLAAGGIELIIKMFLYYIHERLWNKIKWGKNDN